MRKPLVSIIVTTYNTSKYLRTCLDSLINQTLKDLEIICVDDVSTDDTVTILNEYLKKDSRIRVLSTSQNSGISVCRNLGLKSARADYLMFCDGDDYYEPTMCEKMYQAITGSDTDLTISEINVIYHAHADMKTSDDNYYALRFSGRQLVQENLILNTDLSPTNKIFKASLLKDYQLTFPVGYHFEDAYFCAAYFCLCKTAFYLNERLYNYIRHSGSIISETWSGSKTNDYAIDHLFIAFKLYDFLNQHHLYDKYHKLYWQLFLNFEHFALINSKSRARRHEVKTKARNFLNQHHADFSAEKSTNLPTYDRIRQINSKLPYLSTTRLKRLFLKFMPTYRLASENTAALRALTTENQRLLKELQKRSEKSSKS